MSSPDHELHQEWGQAIGSSRVTGSVHQGDWLGAGAGVFQGDKVHPGNGVGDGVTVFQGDGVQVERGGVESACEQVLTRDESKKGDGV